LKEARELCVDAKKLLGKEIDPGAEKQLKAKNLQNTFEKEGR
jgi:hypothetical protein